MNDGGFSQRAFTISIKRCRPTMRCDPVTNGKRLSASGSRCVIKLPVSCAPSFFHFWQPEARARRFHSTNCACRHCCDERRRVMLWPWPQNNVPSDLYPHRIRFFGFFCFRHLLALCMPLQPHPELKASLLLFKRAIRSRRLQSPLSNNFWKHRRTLCIAV